MGRRGGAEELREEAEELKKGLCALSGRGLVEFALMLSRDAKNMDRYSVARGLLAMEGCAEQAEEVCGCVSVKELVDHFERAIHEWVVEGVEESQEVAKQYAKEIMEKVRECKLI